MEWQKKRAFETLEWIEWYEKKKKKMKAFTNVYNYKIWNV